MSITTIGSRPVTPISSEKNEASGTGRNGDRDDAGSGAKALLKASPLPGTGTNIDKTA